jgi:hypothetical protein
VIGPAAAWTRISAASQRFNCGMWVAFGMGPAPKARSMSVAISDDLVRHAAARWAQSVIAVLDCPFDPRTVAMWAHAIGVSEGALKDRCRAARCRPKGSLDFARLLRAVVRSQEHGWDPFNLLDIVNERTMRNLMSRGGVPDLLSPDTRLSPRGFILKQHFVTNPTAVAAVAAAIGL